MKKVLKGNGILLVSAFILYGISGLAMAAGAATPAHATGSAAAAGSASVSGTVTLDGAAPAMEKIKMAADPVCLQQHKETIMKEDVVVNGGKLQNVVVYVQSGLSGSSAAPSTPVVLNQEGCMYKPHVFAIQVGQPLEILNSDATLHNINAQPAENKKFNVAQPVKGMKTTKTFTKPELAIKVKCNVHPWMHAYINVVEYPFFGVTDEAGNFSLQGLPAGTYTLEAWHEKFGAATQTVTVAAGETQHVSFTFKAP